MKYTIAKGTPTFDKLTELRKKADEANKAANALANEFTGHPEEGAKYARDSDCFAGGIKAIRMYEKPEGWRHVSKKWRMLFMPKADNKEALKRISELPRVSLEDLNSLVGFKRYASANSGGLGLTFYNAPGVYWLDDEHLLDVSAKAKFTPNEDMTEILESVYLEKIRKFEESQKVKKT